MNIAEEKTNKIRELNDQFRTTFIGGQVFMTPGVSHLEQIKQNALIRAVRMDTTFKEDNDPHHEHDFGSILFDNDKYFWKIDYYAKGDLDHGSEDSSDPAQTTRVLTIMRADEY